MTHGYEVAKEFIKKKQILKEDKAEFKLKRFQNIDPRTNTNRIRSNSPPKEALGQ